MCLPKKVVFVGDNPEVDIKGANGCGIYTIFVPGPYGSESVDANANCHDFSKLVGIVKNAI